MSQNKPMGAKLRPSRQSVMQLSDGKWGWMGVSTLLQQLFPQRPQDNAFPEKACFQNCSEFQLCGSSSQGHLTCNSVGILRAKPVSLIFKLITQLKQT